MKSYLNEIGKYRINEQIERAVFEIRKYFEYSKLNFELDSEMLPNLFNTSFDEENYTKEELKYIYDNVIEILNKRYFLNVLQK